MGRKSYRDGTPARRTEPAPRTAPAPPAEQPAPVRRYTPRASRAAAPRADATDERQYAYVRRELLRIGLLALALFGSLVVLRIVTTALNLLP